MRKKTIVLLLMVVISSSLLVADLAQAQEQGNSEDLFSIINKLDISASSLRKDDSQPANASIQAAFTQYDNRFSQGIAGVDEALDGQIRDKFAIVIGSPSEGDILSLRSDVIRAAALVGVSLPLLAEYSIFIVLGIGFLAAVFVTLVSKKMVKWNVVKENKAKIAEYYKEYRGAQKKRDMKQVHKIQQRQAEIMQLQKVNTTQNLKPTIIYFVPLLILWMSLGGIFRGWVVVWLPFVRIDIPFIGPLVVFGVGWWYFLTYLGFSQILRKIFIGD
ncbi:MAG: EMC3/TMCO1 family protein [Methanobacteriota archaeon]